MSDVIIRFLTPPNASTMKPCTRRAVELVQLARTAAGLTDAEGGRPLNATEGEGRPAGEGAPAEDKWEGRRDWRFAPSAIFEQTAREMASSVFCLMPAGAWTACHLPQHAIFHISHRLHDFSPLSFLASPHTTVLS